MARVALPLVLQSPVSGSALVGAKFTFTKHEVGKSLGSGAGAEIFLTETESTKVSGSTIETDSTGRLTQGEGASPAFAQYWIPEGRYDVLISGTGLKSVYITREFVTTELDPVTVGGWEAIAYGSFTKKPVAGGKPETRTENGGNTVRLKGTLEGEGASTAGTLLGTLPAAHRPVLATVVTAYKGIEAFPVTIYPTGEIESHGNLTSGNLLHFDGISFSTT